MDASTYSPLLLNPGAPASPSSGWGHVKLSDWRLTFVWKRLARLQELEVTVLVVVKEFVRRRVTPSSATPAQCGTLLASRIP